MFSEQAGGGTPHPEMSKLFKVEVAALCPVQENWLLSDHSNKTHPSHYTWGGAQLN